MTHLFPNGGATPPWVACPALPRSIRGRTLLSSHVALRRARVAVLNDGTGAVIRGAGELTRKEPGACRDIAAPHLIRVGLEGVHSVFVMSNPISCCSIAAMKGSPPSCAWDRLNRP